MHFEEMSNGSPLEKFEERFKKLLEVLSNIAVATSFASVAEGLCSVESTPVSCSSQMLKMVLLLVN